jgi:hypothetical protein
VREGRSLPTARKDSAAAATSPGTVAASEWDCGRLLKQELASSVSVAFSCQTLRSSASTKGDNRNPSQVESVFFFSRAPLISLFF